MVKQTKGFTLLEAVITLSLGGVFLATVLSSWYFSAKTYQEESIRSHLRYDIEKSMERLKSDVRLTDGNGILFYPPNASSYTAISFPGASVDSNGFFTMGSGITWNKTIIYHLYTNSGKTELRRTDFTSFDSNSAARQDQLDAVVEDGDGGAGSTTKTLFSADAGSLSITSTAPTFDGYSATTQLSANTSFGSIKLSSGTHDIKFQVTGKNAASSGYKMGFDTISLTPSGGIQEVEILPISGDTGGSKTRENMISFGSWGGNFQLEYGSSGPGDSITFQTTYDRWLESNFGNMTHSNTMVRGPDPKLTILSRENQSLAPAWQAELQTQAVAPPGETSISDKSVRIVISGSYVTKSAQMIRFKLMASSTNSLTINSAYFGLRDGTSGNFSGAPKRLYFDNPAVQEGDLDPVGAMNVGATSVNIPAGHHVWSNWFEYPIDASAPVPDHLISLSVSGGATSWTGTVTSDNFYEVDGDFAGSASDWSGWDGSCCTHYNKGTKIYAVSQMAAWASLGTATSQVYDTKLTSPAFNQISADTAVPAGASISGKVRSSDNANMAGAADWALLAPITTSPASLAGVPSKRFVQFQITLQAAPPYTSMPEIDNVNITWPGSTTLVELSGYFTKRPDYGIFKLIVDGKNTTKTLGVSLSASYLYRGKTYDHSLSAQVRPRNTGK